VTLRLTFTKGLNSCKILRVALTLELKLCRQNSGLSEVSHEGENMMTEKRRHVLDILASITY
jgi:hypothetical protein